MKDTRLTDTILRKKFNTKALGYCAEEVDAFLDEINIEIEKLEREIEHLKREEYYKYSDFVIIHKDNEGYLSYDSGAYVNILAGALKEAINKIEKLENEIEILKANN